METIDITAPVNLDMDRVAKARIADLAAAREALAAQKVVPGAASASSPAAAPANAGPASPGIAERASTSLKSALPPLPSMPSVSGGAIGKLASGAAGLATKGAGVVAPVMEAVNVGKVALDPAASKIDVATQGAEGAGKLGSAAVGAGLGGMVGGPIGALAGGAAGYVGGDKLIKGLRSLAGVDPTSPADRVVAAPNAAATPPQGRNVSLLPKAQPAPAPVAAPAPAAPPAPGPITQLAAAPQPQAQPQLDATPAPTFFSQPGVIESLGNAKTISGLIAGAGAANIVNKAGIQQDNRVFGRQKDVAEIGAKQAEAKSVEATRAAGNKLTAAQTATAETDLKTKQNLQSKLDELSKLDHTTDPTGEKRRTLQETILVSLGKDPRADKYQVIDNPTGEKDPITGKDVTNKALFNTRTESFVNAPGSKAAQKLPPGMVKQVGTANGKPVYEDAQGKRFQ